jgi:tetratricopeptide (TPR) repeat protein
MKKILILFVISFMFSASYVSAQSPDEEAIKKVILQETEVYMKGDSMIWKGFFIHDKNTYRSYTYFNYNDINIGWDSVSKRVVGFMKEMKTAMTYTALIQNNFNFTLSGKIACVSFDQVFKGRQKGTLPDSYSKEFRTLEKVDGQWKISALETINTNSFISPNPSSIEYIINSSGYNYLTAKKTKEALQVFMTNVALFPKSWNTYDSLGEAYAADGNKKLAIENYEKSIKLNPKNDNGIAMLKRLRANN